MAELNRIESALLTIRDRVEQKAGSRDTSGDVVFDAVAVDKNTVPNRRRFVMDWDKPSDVVLSNFRRNPVLLYFHDSDRIPVGWIEQVDVDDKAVKMVCRIPDLSNEPDMADFDKQILAPIRGAVRSGLLKAVSIGFYILAGEEVKDDKHGFYLRVKKLEIVELSLCSIGAHPSALIKVQGVDIPAFTVGEDTEEATAEAGVLYRMSLHAEHAETDGDAPGDTEAPSEGAGAPSNAQTKPVDQWRAVSWWQSKPERDAAFDTAAEIDAATPDRLAEMATLTRGGRCALIHHRATEGNPVVWEAVARAMAVLLGARNGIRDLSAEARRAAYDHLSAEYRLFGVEPPEYSPENIDKKGLQSLHEQGIIIIPGMALPKAPPVGCETQLPAEQTPGIDEAEVERILRREVQRWIPEMLPAIRQETRQLVGLLAVTRINRRRGNAGRQ